MDLNFKIQSPKVPKLRQSSAVVSDQKHRAMNVASYDPSLLARTLTKRLSRKLVRARSIRTRAKIRIYPSLYHVCLETVNYIECKIACSDSRRPAITRRIPQDFLLLCKRKTWSLLDFYTTP
ncbi:hypothetical protein HYFRA_00006000 [Hymenoscyphus fraxineus]|uniref:Uncharacterized protein n=1 Tax=Hymenoscyphus fraxineus TaxID=746836 RepID=A0A9N9KYD6_9HELO|nr:hypothetical protein HYFRA_00006000 [Hymenoscyphus fraxineus]